MLKVTKKARLSHSKDIRKYYFNGDRQDVM